LKTIGDFVKNFLLRCWTYFRRGYSTYLAFFIAFANFIVIQYRLLISYIPSFKIIFDNLLTFTVLFFIIFTPLSTIIGWYDYKRFAVPIETEILSKSSPWNKDIALALMLIAEGKNKEAVNVLKKWI